MSNNKPQITQQMLEEAKIITAMYLWNNGKADEFAAYQDKSVHDFEGFSNKELMNKCSLFMKNEIKGTKENIEKYSKIRDEFEKVVKMNNKHRFDRIAEALIWFVEKLNHENNKSKEYTFHDDDAFGMVAEPVAEYGNKSKWNSILHSKSRPTVGQQVLIAGYIAPGHVQYILGSYQGNNEWHTLFDDDPNSPMFNVLYWMLIPGVPEEAFEDMGGIDSIDMHNIY